MHPTCCTTTDSEGPGRADGVHPKGPGFGRASFAVVAVIHFGGIQGHQKSFSDADADADVADEAETRVWVKKTTLFLENEAKDGREEDLKLEDVSKLRVAPPSTKKKSSSLSWIRLKLKLEGPGRF